MDAEIEFFPDGIDKPVVQGEIQFEAGILFQQCAEQWCDMSPVERDRCRDSQRTYGRRGVFLYFISGLVSAAWGEALCSSGSRHRAPVGAAAQCCKAESTPPGER